MKIVTSATVFRDALGMRLSYTFSEVDEETGKIISDNNRANRMITDADAQTAAESVLDYASASLEG